MTEGTGISLVGGNFTVRSGSLDDGTIQSANLSAPGGQIKLASVASPGEILFPGLQSAPNINGQSFASMGNISLSEGSMIDVSADKAGTIQIRGGQLVISDSTLAANTINSDGATVAVDVNLSGDLSLVDTTGVTSISAQTAGTGNAGAVNITSANVTASSTSTSGFPGTIIIDTHTSGSGKGGDVNIITGHLDASNPLDSQAVFIDTGFTANGQGGNISIKANRFNLAFQIVTTGDFTATAASNFDAVGSAGNIAITADDIQIRNASIFADSAFVGNGGNLTFQAKNMLVHFSNITAFGFQKAGFIDIKADSLSSTRSLISSNSFFGPGGINIVGSSILFTDGTTVVSSTAGDGDAGPINITAHDQLTLSGFLQSGPFGRPTGIFSNSFGISGSHGKAGTITINTPRLVMTDGARINTATAANGRGGDVIINAQSVSTSGEFPAFIPEDLFSLGTVNAGGIGTLTIGGSCVGPCGNAGNISITANSLNVADGARINSSTTSDGNGGLTTINARDTISISGKLNDGTPGGVFSETLGLTSGSGAGGNISLIAGQSVSISNDASVSASTTGPGNAGHILVKANDIAISGAGTINAASTGAGNAGSITIQGVNSPANSFLGDGAASGLFTNTQDTGAGGNISIDANTVTLQNGGTLSASTSGSAASSSGGTITVNADQVQINNGGVFTGSTTGAGTGGSVNMNAG